MSTEVGSRVSYSKLGSTGLIVGIVGLVALGAGFVGSVESALQSYVLAYAIFLALTLGCFGLTLLHHTVRGSWGLAVLRLWEAGGGPAMILAMGLGTLPLVFGMGTVYHHWMHAEANDIVLQRKAWFLNPTTFVVTTAVLFGAWFWWAFVLRRSSLKQDETRDSKETARRTRWAAPGLAVLVLGLSLGYTHWFMSLDPHWFSSIAPALYLVTGALGAMAFTTLLVCANADKEPYKSIITPNLTKDLGNMCFTFTLVWMYFTLSQFLIIWSGNLPEFTPFYLNRREQPILTLAWLNVTLGFFVPFLALLSPRVKRYPNTLLQIVALIVVMRVVDLIYNTLPYMRASFAWTDAAALAGVGGVWLAIFAQQTRKADLYPAHDPRLVEAAAAAHHHA